MHDLSSLILIFLLVVLCRMFLCHVFLEVRRCAALVVAVIAGKKLLSRMSEHMGLKVGSI